MDRDAEKKGHSEEWFGDYRDFWYNHDFLELMARRWKLDKVDSLLDVGCGQWLLKDSLSDSDSIEDIVMDVRAALILERGKKKAQLGDNSLGDLLPGMFGDAGLDEIKCFLSDKCNTMVPPYNTPEMKTMAAHVLNENEFKAAIDEQRKSYISYVVDTGCEQVYEDIERRELFCKERELESMRAGTFNSAGGSLMYLVSGIKP